MVPCMSLSIPSLAASITGERMLTNWNGFGRGVADLVVAAFSHLAWPAVVLVLASMFRKSVSDLLERVQFASWKGGKLTLGTRRLLEKLGQAEAMANALAFPPAIAPGRSPADGVEQGVKQCLNTASKQPGRAMADAW